MSRYPMTKEGEGFLREELKNLKSGPRTNIVKAIAEARKLGDLKENAEYHAALEQQRFIESRIREIESKLADAQIIDITQIQPTGKVIFGTIVQIKDLELKEQVSYKIVGEDEADIKLGKISVNSPLSRNLIGKFEGDSFRFETPNGDKEFKIISIKHL